MELLKSQMEVVRNDLQTAKADVCRAKEGLEQAEKKAK